MSPASILGIEVTPDMVQAARSVIATACASDSDMAVTVAFVAAAHGALRAILAAADEHGCPRWLAGSLEDAGPGHRGDIVRRSMAECSRLGLLLHLGEGQPWCAGWASSVV